MQTSTLVLQGEDIVVWVGSFLWPLFRILGLVMVAPLFSTRAVPNTLRLGFGVVLALVAAPLIPPVPAVDPLSIAALMITAQQVTIGVAMGLALQMVFHVFVVAGQIIAYQMGLGFASMVDPQSGTQVPVISQFYLIVVTLVFLAIDGHLIVVEVLVDSFRTLPISAHGISVESMWTLVLWGGELYAGAVRIALPAIASILLINVTFGVITRSAPQFNVFSIGFPVTLIFGLLVIMMTLSFTIGHTGALLDSGFGLVRSLVGN